MNYLIKGATIINEGKEFVADLLIKKDRIERIDQAISTKERVEEIIAEGQLLMPGIIDDQVHFREPGLTHKGTIHTESMAAVAGGVTSFMDMPNVNPPSLTRQLLEERYRLAAKESVANYSFYMGVSNDNAEEVLRTDALNVCGIKIFMGSSTGNMLVDDERTLEHLFKNAPLLIATHCEDEATILHNLEVAKEKFGNDIPVNYHPVIRNETACYLSSSFAVELAKKHDTRLHVLHISTADEIKLFTNSVPLEKKRITAEVCVHHLFFDADDYETLGAKIKWNPAIKDKKHKPLLLEALLNGTFDVLATDHAPHTAEEKANSYIKCPGGAPMVQHSLNVMMEMHGQHKISLTAIAEKMSHNVATCFKIKERGFLREGYFADLFLFDPKINYTVTPQNILYKCGWSPLEGRTFNGRVVKTFVNGNPVFANNIVDEQFNGARLQFDRK